MDIHTRSIVGPATFHARGNGNRVEDTDWVGGFLQPLFSQRSLLLVFTYDRVGDQSNSGLISVNDIINSRFQISVLPEGRCPNCHLVSVCHLSRSQGFEGKA